VRGGVVAEGDTIRLVGDPVEPAPGGSG
jgi:hypothetical protein